MAPLQNAVDVALRQLPLGNLAFNAPTSLHRDETAEIHLIVSLRDSAAQLRRKIREAGTKEGARVKLSSDMIAHLTGLGFRIDAATPERQAVSGDESTEWIWDVEPTRTGVLRLHLTLSAVLAVDGEKDVRTIRTFSRQMKIRVTLGERISSFFSSNWQWIWTAIFVPLGAWVIRRRRSTRGTSEPTAGATDQPG